MAYSHLYNINVCIRYLFVVFAPDFMIPPNVFDGRDGFARRHAIRTSCHSRLGAYSQGLLPSQIGALEIV
jgi:hypothetical protein